MVDKGQWWTMDKGGVVYLQLNKEHGAVHRMQTCAGRPHWISRLITNSSRQGIGWILLQHTEEGDWRIVPAGSAALGPAQRNYPAIQLELLQVAHAMEKCDFYLRSAPRFELVGVSSCVGATKCWPEYKSLREAAI